ncbi:MAG: dCTP deaminase [Firmicutes bacterium]|nr:dCTP deaminase [Bacillota bacterium]
MIFGIEKINQMMELGQIVVTPFDQKKLNPNSIDLTLGDTVFESPAAEFDVKIKTEFIQKTIGESGFLLSPNQLYLAATAEWTKTVGAVPIIFGKSSLSRLGLSVHQTGGFGDNGFEGNWTLALACVKPIRIYAGMKICQLVYFGLDGGGKLYDSDKYQSSKGAVASKFYKEFENLKGD